MIINTLVGKEFAQAVETVRRATEPRIKDFFRAILILLFFIFNALIFDLRIAVIYLILHC